MATVLIVEDMRAEAELMSYFLLQGGLSTIVVGSSEEAKDKIAQVKPDVVVLDVVLPGESGFELCRELKQNDATRDIPIIFCSTKGGQIDKFWGMKQGASAYLTKPIDPDELLRTVELLVQGQLQ